MCLQQRVINVSQCSIFSATKWTLRMLPFPLLQKHKLRTERRRTVRTRTVQISLLLWVWNGAAPVVNSHRGVYSSIVLSFSDCLNCLRKNSAECPILTFADPFSIALCCTKNAECFSFRSFFVMYLCFYSTFPVQILSLKDLLVNLEHSNTSEDN